MAPVRVSPAIKGSIRLIVNADAVLFPRDQANIVPKISAPVRRFLVNRGDHVKQGQLLAELEARDLAAAAQESRGQYEQAQSNYRSTTAAGVPEQMTKAQTDVDRRARGDGRREAAARQPPAAVQGRRARAEARRRSRGRLRAGEGALRHRAAAPAGAAERRQARNRSTPRQRRSRRPRAITRARRRRRATPRSAARSPASSPTGRCIPARWPPPARRC